MFVLEVAEAGGAPRSFEAHGIKVGHTATSDGQGVAIRFGAGTFSPVRVDVALPPAAVPALIAALQQAAGLTEGGP